MFGATLEFETTHRRDAEVAENGGKAGPAARVPIILSKNYRGLSSSPSPSDLQLVLRGTSPLCDVTAKIKCVL